MKIAVVSIGSFDTQYSDYHIMRDIILSFLQKGHDVFLVQKTYLEQPRYPKEFASYLGNRLQVVNTYFEKKAKGNLKARYLADLKYYYHACQLLKGIRPDKIFLQSNNTAFLPVFYAKHILHCPLHYNEQDLFPENALFAGLLSKKSLIYRVAHFLQGYTYRNAASLSTISDDMKATIMDRYDIPDEKVHVIYNWGHEELQANTVTENHFLKKYPKRANEFRVVYAGNLGKMQNVELILQAAKCLKQIGKETGISFYIIGSGVNEESLKEMAVRENLDNVVFVGMQPPEEVADLYAAADVNLIPLQKGIVYAALPSKTPDCLMAGKPIITCVDESSSFAKSMEQYGFANVSPVKADDLAKEILAIRENGQDAKAAKMLQSLFAKKENTARYCSLMEAL
jgi:colanic acid biosynthesis glycosyl transferase WcaI